MKFAKCIVLLLTIGINSDLLAQHATDETPELSEEALADSSQINLLLDTSQKQYNIDLKKSLLLAQDALSHAEKINYDKGIQNALGIMSRIQRRLGNFSVAIEYNLRELSIAEKRKDTDGMIDSYTTLGNIYSSLENYSEAKKNLAMANMLGQSVNSRSLSSIMNFIGRNFGKMHEYDSAEYWILKALNHEKKFPTKGYALSYIYNNLAEVYYAEGKYKQAIKYYLISKDLPEDKKSPFGKTFTLNGLARTYKELKRFDEAIEAARESILISKEFAYRDKAKESYGILSEIFEDKRDFHDALRNYKLFNLYQDSIFNADNIEYIENLKIQYETEQVKTENELLRKDAELKDSNLAQQRKLTLVGSIALISLVGAILFLYYGYRQKKKTNRFLAEFNKNLQEQVEERTRELVKSNLELIKQNNQLEQYGYITAHNLRSPVARILGLTNMLKSDRLNPDEDLYIVEKLRITTLELDTIIHDMNAILDIKNGVENSYEVIDFHEQLEKVKSMLKESIANTKAVILEDFTAAKSCYAIPTYIESILYNLISNSIKYRSSKRKPEIIIRSSIKDGLLELTVADNGLGIEPNLMKDKIFNLYQRFHDHVEGKGMGLFLVRTQVEALNGNIRVESIVNEGTTFLITIPLLVRS